MSISYLCTIEGEHSLALSMISHEYEVISNFIFLASA